MLRESFPLSREGFVCHWFISGPRVGDFVIDNPYDDQLRFEKYMRGVLRDGKSFQAPADAALGSASDLGMPWRYSGGGSRYVDVSFFYSLPARVELYAYSEIIAEKDLAVPAELWTYAAVDLWFNGSPVCTAERPVYKPITRKQMNITLRKGKNSIFIRLQNLGVRDTRSIFALQFREETEFITVTLPGDGEKLIALDNYLQSIYCEGDTIVLPPDAPGKISLEPGGIPSGNQVKAPEGCSKILIKGGLGEYSLERTVGLIGRIRPELPDPGKGADERRRDVLNQIAHSTKDSRFKCLNILARYALGIARGEGGSGEREAILHDLERINERIDCSDFIAAAIIRLMKTYKLSKELTDKIRETFLNYRFWMDEKGSDGMCFWSENHSLLFHGAQLLTGLMYPDDIFTRSGRSGSQQAEAGFRRCQEWLEDVKDSSFEEFLSSGYMCVTAGALLNLVDFAPEPLSSRAAEVMDMLLEQLCQHSFQGSVIGPQGRVYGDVIFPFLQGTQAIIHYINPDSPTAENDWPVFFATSKYKPPERLKSLMEAELSERYSCGNGEIVLEKRKNFILTSLASPKQDSGLKWRNISFDENAVRDSFKYTKSLNERFHGTTDFRPGVFGYQQHFWYAALSNECVVFTNLPGGDADHSSMRPGYWYGNGIFPAVKQDRNVLGVIHVIPESYPIHFTHLFFPAPMFDEYRQENNWLFARKKGAWMGIWSNTKPEWHNGMFSRCELRSYLSLQAGAGKGNPSASHCGFWDPSVLSH
jgi:hypothetical protein